ncbi:MAG: hypothetical protein ACRDVM_05740 [Acidimicrobiia bacterium]
MHKTFAAVGAGGMAVLILGLGIALGGPTITDPPMVTHPEGHPVPSGDGFTPPSDPLRGPAAVGAIPPALEAAPSAPETTPAPPETPPPMTGGQPGDGSIPLPVPPPGDAPSPASGHVPPPPSGDSVESTPPPAPGDLQATLSGEVAMLDVHSKGDLHGLVLADGTVVRFPPHVGRLLAGWASVGASLEVDGWWHTTPHGDLHFQAARISGAGGSVEVTGPPPPHHGNHPAPPPPHGAGDPPPSPSGPLPPPPPPLP